MSVVWRELQRHLESQRLQKIQAEKRVRRILLRGQVAISRSAAHWVAESYGWQVAPLIDQRSWLLRKKAETILLRALPPSDPATWLDLASVTEDAWTNGAEGAILIAPAGLADPDLGREYSRVQVYGLEELVSAYQGLHWPEGRQR